jgi:steroid 5-alpha reductase family enzyme
MSENQEDKSALSRKYLIGVLIGSFSFTQLVSWGCSQGGNNLALHYIAAAAIIIQLVVYLHASGILFGNEMTEKYYDLTGSGTFISLILSSVCIIPSKSARQWVLSICVLVWACRLGLFLFFRIHNNGGVDSRFVRLKSNRYRFAIPWTVQGVWVFITALPVFIVNTSADVTDLNFIDALGVFLWCVGFLFEVVADDQKRRFKLQFPSKDKQLPYITTGLWSLSRHPNCK